MAKYWVFQNNQVNGPHDAEDLSQLPGFSAESLVCPEGRKGTNMGDWQRASMVPQLSVSLLKASQLAVAMKGSATGSMFGNLPPEPTLKDLAALGSLQEKVSLLDSTVGQLQESLQLKESELLSVHRELEEKSRYAQELAVKLGGVEERLSSVGALREGLDRAVAAEQDVEQAVQRQSETVEELTRQLTAMREEINELRARPAAAASASLGMPMPAPSLPMPSPSLAMPMPAPSPAPIPSTMSFGMSAPAVAAPLLSEPEPAGPSMGLAEPFTQAEPFAPTQTFGLSEPAPSFSPFSETPAPIEPMPSEHEPVAAAPAPVAASASKKPGSRKLVLAVLALVVVGAGAMVKLGVFSGARAPEPNAVPEQAAAPAASAPVVEAQVPPQPSPEAQAEALKQEAIELVRAWPAGTTTLAAQLETPSVQAGGTLSPWQADRVRDGIYQVNLYSPKSSGGTGKTFEFEADLAARRVTARNAAAVAALTGAKQTPTLASRRKPKIKAKRGQDAAVLQDLLGLEAGPKPAETPAEPAVAEDAAPAPVSRRATARARKVKAQSLDELLAGSREPRKTKKPVDETLDQILLPGIPRRAQDLDEPQAQGAPEETLAGEEPEEPKPVARRPSIGKKPVKKAADAALLDDLLKP